MTLTKEWLRKTIAELEEERDAVPGVVNVDAGMALAAMKLALASLEAEPGVNHQPVAWQYKEYVYVSGLGYLWREKLDCEFPGAECETLKDVVPLYTAPPAPVSVPDELLSAMEEVLRISDRDHDAWHKAKAGILSCRAAMLQGADEKPELTVWYGSMPESNGKANWTAILHRKGEGRCMDGFTIDRSEYPGRVLYAADRVRYLIGEKSERPIILDYDAEAHSGYVKPGNSPVIPDGWVLVPIEPTYQMCEAMGLQWESPRFPDRYKAMLAAVKK
ncbi:hypothetical protein [Enterobacter hormaechei]|uniref:hypothetical protein n=1 Tax=Enterobacter hormaechei TaxID=158836 RepID=UPI000698AE19|nr:hypothetical protein [Enterobacter hormaechei]